MRSEFRSRLIQGLLLLAVLATVPALSLTFSLVAILITAIVFFFALLIGSQLLLPLPVPTLDDRIQTFLAFLGWLFGMHRPSFLVEDVTVKRTIDPGSGVLPGVIVVDGHSAVVTKRFQHYLRVLGPGTHFSVPFERVPVVGDGSRRAKVREVVDLRKQMRFQPVSAQTKDGMTIKTAFFAQFYIDRDPDPKLDRHSMYRYYEYAVQKAVMSERIGEKPGEYYDWTSLPVALGVDLLLHIISTYTLDELYAPREDDEGLSPLDMRKKIREEMTNGLREKLKDYGIYLIVAGCGKIAPGDERVTQERIGAWRARRERQIVVAQALALASVERERELSRSQAERDMILRILEGLQTIPPQYYDTLVPLRLVAALEVLFGGAGEEQREEKAEAPEVKEEGR
jgi:hypothetical protein